jgi:hypothetical protein
MTKRVKATAVTLLALGGGLIPSSVEAAHDTQPPVLSTPIKAQFVVGAHVDQFRDQAEGHAYYDVPMRLSWSATDNVDTELNYDVWEHPLGAEPNRIGNFITATSLDVTASDYDGFFGGAALVIANWSIQAYDDADNSSERSVYGAQLLVTQDNGSQTFGSESTDVSVKYLGNWATAVCTCFADRTTHHTSADGAAVVITVVVPTDEDLRRVALVMDTGPNRGRAKVKVDGALRKTIDTSRDTAMHKVVVWTGTMLPGKHRLRIVNLATAGRARIDFDAVIDN